MTALRPPCVIERLSLSDVGRDEALAGAFAAHESSDFQFGLDWYRNLARHGLQAREQPLVYVARQRPDEFVACPMRILVQRREGHALSTFYTSLYAPLLHSDRPGPLCTALFRHLAREERLSTLTIAPCSPADATLALLAESATAAGWRGVHDYFCFGNWIHDVQPGGYRSYLASRSSRVQNTLKRRSARFLQDGRGTLAIVTGGAALADAAQAFIAVYDRSWKQPEPHPGFIPGLLQLAADRGWLRLGLARYDGTVVAGQLWLVANGVASIYKLAHDSAFERFSPGSLLTAHLMEHVLDHDAVTRVDYLSGDDAYKQDWMSTRRERRGLAAYNPATVRGAARAAGEWCKRLVRR